MNILLFFFALPIATIILAIALEKILRCPVLTASVFFAIFLILAFTVFDTTFLIFAIVYTILAFIVAVLAEIFFKNRKKCCCIFCSNEDSNEEQIIRLSNQDIRSIANEVADVLCNNTCNCNCSRRTSENNGITWGCNRR